MNEVKPCPHCGVNMQGLEKTFCHPGVVGDDGCINNGKSFYWRYLELWNTRGEGEMLAHAATLDELKAEIDAYLEDE